MVRVSLKGGVWKNSEDEILKAAVQKYGKQQWARVASLLNRKTAKQAKARWYEWLDPSIRKVEWTPQQEERLLHLAKLLPAQWRTIAPLVGNKTATQCQEHYEALLDQAATAQSDSSASVASSLARQGGGGHVDLHPESRPARPDPVDMDEDELEMLQEARARLANTVGKKAKRKQRERALQQAKLLADLQKRRELKQAGLLSKAAAAGGRRRNRREIDLGVEIPFHKPAPAGFHDTSSEDQRAERIRQKQWRKVDFSNVHQQQYRTRDREAAAAQRRHEARLRVLEQGNQQVREKEEETAATRLARPRGSMQLPQPQVTDAERYEYQQLRQREASSSSAVAAAVGQGSVTDALLGDYTDRPLPTPLRRPPTAGTTTTSTLHEKASQLRQLEQSRTPLLPMGQGLDDQDDDESDGKPHAKPPPEAAATVGRKTPLVPTQRDVLGLNEVGDDDNTHADNKSYTTYGTAGFSAATSLRDLARQERRAAQQARKALEAALQALPAPQFEYELAAPSGTDLMEEDGQEKGAAVGFVPDQADVLAAEEQKKRQEEEREMARISTVVKRSDLPRPGRVKPLSLGDDQLSPQNLVEREMVQLILHDGVHHPVETTDKKKRKRAVASVGEPLEDIPDHYLDLARAAIENAANDGNPGNKADNIGMDVEMCYTQAGWVNESSASGDTSASLTSLKLEWETLHAAWKTLKAKNEKTTKKLSIINGGYPKRAQALAGEVLQLVEQHNNTSTEVGIFARLRVEEQQGGKQRVSHLEEMLDGWKRHEATLQREYSSATIKKRRLLTQQSKQSANSN